jgi:hypothetical protein
LGIFVRKNNALRRFQYELKNREALQRINGNRETND